MPNTTSGGAVNEKDWNCANCYLLPHTAFIDGELAIHPSIRQCPLVGFDLPYPRRKRSGVPVYSRFEAYCDLVGGSYALGVDALVHRWNWHKSSVKAFLAEISNAAGGA